MEETEYIFVCAWLHILAHSGVRTTPGLLFQSLHFHGVFRRLCNLATDVTQAPVIRRTARRGHGRRGPPPGSGRC